MKTRACRIRLAALAATSAALLHSGGVLAGDDAMPRISERPKAIILPSEAAAFKPGPNADLAQRVCSECHSVDYPTTQPRLTRTQWQAEIDKMRNTFGAGPTWTERGISEEQLQQILDYLVRFYGTE